MPTYEYECSRCGAITEVFQSMTDKPRRKLRKEDQPKCNCNAPVSRRISGGGGLIFKGSGFYITDYRSEGYKKAAKSESEGGSGSSKTDSSGSESKPAADAPAKPPKKDKSSEKAGKAPASA